MAQFPHTAVVMIYQNGGLGGLKLFFSDHIADLAAMSSHPTIPCLFRGRALPKFDLLRQRLGNKSLLIVAAATTLQLLRRWREKGNGRRRLKSTSFSENVALQQ